MCLMYYKQCARQTTAAQAFINSGTSSFQVYEHAKHLKLVFAQVNDALTINLFILHEVCDRRKFYRVDRFIEMLSSAFR